MELETALNALIAIEQIKMRRQQMQQEGVKLNQALIKEQDRLKQQEFSNKLQLAQELRLLGNVGPTSGQIQKATQPIQQKTPTTFPMFMPGQPSNIPIPQKAQSAMTMKNKGGTWVPDLEAARARTSPISEAKSMGQYAAQGKIGAAMASNIPSFTPKTTTRQPTRMEFMQNLPTGRDVTIGKQTYPVKYPASTLLETVESLYPQQYEIPIGFEPTRITREGVTYEEPEGEKLTADWAISGGYKYNKRTGEIILLPKTTEEAKTYKMTPTDLDTITSILKEINAAERFLSRTAPFRQKEKANLLRAQGRSFVEQFLPTDKAKKAFPEFYKGVTTIEQSITGEEITTQGVDEFTKGLGF
jgi:hypothetical protein